MGSFASTFLRALLSWVRPAADWVWRFAENSGAENLFAWLGRNWLGAAIILCVLGMLIDGVVHWFRWRPYEVWKSFFRRMRQNGDVGQDNQGKVRRWVYADGSDVLERMSGSGTDAVQEPAGGSRKRAERKPAGAKWKLPSFFTEDDLSDKPIAFHPAPPARNKDEAYGKPFYPGDWSKTENHQSK